MFISNQMGLSAQAIAYGGSHHPWDPSDLRRCMEYCANYGVSTDELRKRMAGRSIEWDRLLPEWDSLITLLKHEIATSTNGTAPRTYHEMKRILADGLKCDTCDSTGRGAPCAKCKGTGTRTSGRCRARDCYRGFDFCATCRGNGYIKKEA